MLFFPVALVEFSKNLFEGDEIDGAVEVCLSKDVETASRFEVTLLPQETIPSPPDTFQARGVCCLHRLATCVQFV